MSDRFIFDGTNIYDNLSGKYLETVFEIVDMLNLLNEQGNFRVLGGDY